MNKTPFALLVFALALCSSVSLSAQTRFGLKAGFNLASMQFSDDYVDILEFVGGEELEMQSLPAWHAGAVVEFGLGGNFGLGTGIEFQVKGTKQVFSGEILNVPFTNSRNVTPMYLQLPLALTFRTHGFYASAGPYIGFAVAGKDKTTIESGGASSENSEDIDFGNEEGKDFNNLDYGASFALGYEFAGTLRLSVSYQLGISNNLPADEVTKWEDLGADLSAKNNVLGISLTYLFGSDE